MSPSIWDGDVMFGFRSRPRDMIVQYEYRRGQLETDVIRVVRGNKMPTVGRLIDEISAAFQLYEDIGSNWHALQETLQYMDEVWDGSGYLIVFSHADLVLSKEPDQIEWLMKVLIDVWKWWSSHVTDNHPYNRPPMPFRCIFESGEQWCKYFEKKIKPWGASCIYV